MRKIATFIFLILSTIVFAIDTDVYKKNFTRDFLIIEKGNKLLLKESFSDNSIQEITLGLEFRGKRDKHITTHYKILTIDAKGGYLKIEYKKIIDLRSLGEELKNKMGSFYYAYK